ncbi:DUF2312 domain-containing protein [Methylorubrum thiocyanatum]|uniref:Uncharacterized protein (UPF0335 family) n=1 Tax=Methylorubrum thiocyanatum TaxID=47958 RepID=A0AA40S040_9HYPH|nr:GapR family DNA-binding domain-containing protein [Methylorubrum thiocyanatum]MBA8912066.1 uncharacterized protein (UPF0335 family) [Methylorubrum thiocyanatum]GJE79641.1 hypothetical protein CJNNKLLH_0967 [Methylorubrum thiocyanatum]
MGNTSRRRAQPNSSAADMLRSFAERIVRLKEEIKVFQADIKDIRNEAGAQGYDKKALMLVVARMMEDSADKAARQETAALADVYLASLGMLDGTPLGDAARRRFDPIDDPADGMAETDEGADRDDDGSLGGEHEDASPPSGAMSEETIAAAREEGSAAAEAGERVFANPYVAGDPRRAAWDEGWCVRKGSDGMEIPDAFRRKKKSAADDAGDEASA